MVAVLCVLAVAGTPQNSVLQGYDWKWLGILDMISRCGVWIPTCQDTDWWVKSHCGIRMCARCVWNSQNKILQMYTEIEKQTATCLLALSGNPNSPYGLVLGQQNQRTTHPMSVQSPMHISIEQNPSSFAYVFSPYRNVLNNFFLQYITRND
jgi:hypothetical protein